MAKKGKRANNDEKWGTLQRKLSPRQCLTLFTWLNISGLSSGNSTVHLAKGAPQSGEASLKVDRKSADGKGRATNYERRKSFCRENVVMSASVG